MTVPAVDFLFVHVPKLGNYYKPIDEFLFINYLPMGVFGLCDLLNRNQIRSRIIHLGIETIEDPTFSIAGHVKDNAIRAVGMSLHWHYQAFDVIDVARKIKAASPETKIVLGGLTASRFAREILETWNCVDAVVKGDGEKGVLDVARAWTSGSTDCSSAANVVWRCQGAVVDNGISYTNDFREFPKLDYANLALLEKWELYRTYFKMPLFWSLNASVKENVERKISGAMTTFPLHVGLGCSVNCSFCGGGRDAHRSLCNRSQPVFRPVADVVDTMEKALACGYESFVVCFDPLPRQDSYYLELFAEVRRRKFQSGMGFEAWGLPSEAFIDAFRETFVLGKSYVALSPETGSDEIRKRNKGFPYTNAQMMETMDLLASAAVPTLVYFTFGLPGETLADIEKTHQLAKLLKGKYKRNLLGTILVPVQIEPGSPIFEAPERFGVRTERRTFADFYAFHGKTSNPFCYLGYVTDSLLEAEGDIRKFETLLQRIRCRQFCVIPKAPQPIPRLICKMAGLRWKRRGHGSAPQTRRTFD